MKLLVFIVIATTIYILALGFLITELKNHPSEEERKRNQSFPLIFASTVLYLVVVIHTIQLTLQGVLPLL